jgi:predicted O-linked N-acetylglucosamine transferase (SPINDLY family)
MRMTRNGRLPPGKINGALDALVGPLLDRADRLLAAGKGAEAIEPLTKANALARSNPQAAHMLGVAYLQAGRLAEGIEALKKAAMLAPKAPPILNHLGVALYQAGRAAEGIPYLRKAAALAPDMADVRNNLAHALNESGAHREAAAEYAALVPIAPRMLPVRQGLISSLSKAGDFEGALKAAESAVRDFPENSGFFASLGRVLFDLRRPADAESAFRKALALDPANGEAANNLGTLIGDRGRSKEALELYELAAKVRPNLGDAWFNLGSAHEKAGDLLKAKQALERCIALRPGSSKTLSALINVRRKLCDWDGLDAQVETLTRLVQAPDFGRKIEDTPAPFGLLSLMIGAEDQLRAAEVHSKAIEQKAAGWLPSVGAFQPQHRPLDGCRIRVGYLSPDFREHPIAQLMAGVIDAHDRARFEISAWSLGPDDASRFRKRIEEGADRFEDMREWDIAVSTRMMRDADLDIVVDLAGYTAHARPEILALKVAPIQVNYLGYPGSMGASFIDCILVDPVLAGDGDERFYSERVIRLPDCYQANDNKALIDPESVARADFGLPDDAFVFCSFSMNYKIDAPALDAWTNILQKTPNSILWLFRTDAVAADNLHREFNARGIGRDRVIFADRLSKAKHLARHRLADLFLDTFAYGAHTTASDALWAGLPVLTCRGDTFARRVGASIVKAACMPELVTETVADYIAKAIEIGSTPGLSAALKAQLAENIPRCPLFSTAAIARNLEAAYLSMIADLQK